MFAFDRILLNSNNFVRLTLSENRRTNVRRTSPTNFFFLPFAFEHSDFIFEQNILILFDVRQLFDSFKKLVDPRRSVLRQFQLFLFERLFQISNDRFVFVRLRVQCVNNLNVATSNYRKKNSSNQNETQTSLSRHVSTSPEKTSTCFFLNNRINKVFSIFINKRLNDSSERKISSSIVDD